MQAKKMKNIINFFHSLFQKLCILYCNYYCFIGFVSFYSLFLFLRASNFCEKCDIDCWIGTPNKKLIDLRLCMDQWLWNKKLIDKKYMVKVLQTKDNITCVKHISQTIEKLRKTQNFERICNDARNFPFAGDHKFCKN